MQKNSGRDLPLLKAPVPKCNEESFFAKKLRQCCMVLYNTTDPLIELKYKELKKKTLNEMMEYISTQREAITETVPEIFDLFSCNVLRTLPPSSTLKGADDPHLYLVYEFFIKFLELPFLQACLVQRFVDQKFLLQLLELFDNEDPTERNFLLTILHIIYEMCFLMRAYIRKAINNIFLNFIYETEKHNGIKELLQFLFIVIAGFDLPLSEECKVFLLKVLVPLHKVNCLRKYHQQLCFCIKEFLKKDPNLTEPFFNGLLRFWPKVHSHKEILFLVEVEGILFEIEQDEFKKVMVPLFKQLAKCVSSPHAQVAEYTLLCWKEKRISRLVKENAEELFPILLPSLFNAYFKSHWNNGIKLLIFKSLVRCLKMNEEMYKECAENYKNDDHNEEAILKEREDVWKKIELLAAKNILESSSADLPIPLLNSNEQNISESAPADLPIPLLDCNEQDISESAQADLPIPLLDCNEKDISESAPADLPIPLLDCNEQDISESAPADLPIPLLDCNEKDISESAPTNLRIPLLDCNEQDISESAQADLPIPLLDCNEQDILESALAALPIPLLDCNEQDISESAPAVLPIPLLDSNEESKSTVDQQKRRRPVRNTDPLK